MNIESSFYIYLARCSSFWSHHSVLRQPSHCQFTYHASHSVSCTQQLWSYIGSDHACLDHLEAFSKYFWIFRSKRVPSRCLFRLIWQSTPRQLSCATCFFGACQWGATRCQNLGQWNFVIGSFPWCCLAAWSCCAPDWPSARCRRHFQIFAASSGSIPGAPKLWRGPRYSLPKRNCLSRFCSAAGYWRGPWVGAAERLCRLACPWRRDRYFQ